MSSAAFQPQIILLREGTDTSQGKAQIISNINACQAVAESVRTTLGPRGMDKLVFDGKRTTISNDGATIMRLLDIVHPAAKTLVDISMAQVSFFTLFFFLFIMLKLFLLFNIYILLLLITIILLCYFIFNFYLIIFFKRMLKLVMVLLLLYFLLLKS